jgi:lauroyl/myristoyl acyltransferase
MFGTARHGSVGVRNDSEGLMAKKNPLSHKIRDWLQDRALRVMIGGALLLPYSVRVRAGGWLFARVLAPIAGYSTRIRDNLNLIFPDLPVAEVTRLIDAVANNTGRTVIEIYSGAQFVQRVTQTPLTGPGLAALEAAHKTKRPVILVTGHFGNYDASRAGLIARGFRVGALYNPMGNRFFNSHYVRAISRIGTPLFPRGKRGLGEMVRFLRGGACLVCCWISVSTARHCCRFWANRRAQRFRRLIWHCAMMRYWYQPMRFVVLMGCRLIL